MQKQSVIGLLFKGLYIYIYIYPFYEYITQLLLSGGSIQYWVLVKGFNLSYQNKETILFTIDPHYGNLN